MKRHEFITLSSLENKIDLFALFVKINRLKINSVKNKRDETFKSKSYIHTRIYNTYIEAIDINNNKFYFNVKIKKYVKNMQKFFNNYIVLYYLNLFFFILY